MADQPKSEMFMKFVKKDDWHGGGPVWAECAAEKDPDDDWMTDFSPQDVDTYSDFFEVTKFEFGVEVKPEDTSKSGSMAQPAHGGAHRSGLAPAHGHGNGKNDKKQKAKDAWQSWRSANTDADVDNMKYPFEVDKFQFERLIDGASIELFEACCGSQTFKSAVLVKRVSGGGQKPAKAFLRIEFEEVMITGLNWDDGDMLNESCEFICRGFKYQYRRQAEDGSLLEPVSAEWHYKVNPLGKRNGK